MYNVMRYHVETGRKLPDEQGFGLMLPESVLHVLQASTVLRKLSASGSSVGWGTLAACRWSSRAV